MCLVFTDQYTHSVSYRMKGLQVTGGMVDGIYSSVDSEAGYYFGVAMATYAKRNKWMFGGVFGKILSVPGDPHMFRSLPLKEGTI